jgi:hypothetical protein
MNIFINNNSELLRGSMVDHEGKRELNVKVGPEVDIMTFTELMIPKLAENIKDSNFVKMAMPDYSTTTPLIQCVAGTTVMSAVKTYFQYTMILGCGIPTVILGGTTEDWVKLYDIYNQMKMFMLNNDKAIEYRGLVAWAKNMDIIMNMLVDMKHSGIATEIQRDIWSKIITMEKYGSGSQAYFGGWGLCFFPYNISNKIHSLFYDDDTNIMYALSDKKYDKNTCESQVRDSHISKSILSMNINIIDQCDNKTVHTLETGFFNQPHIDDNNVVKINYYVGINNSSGDGYDRFEIIKSE